MKAFTSYVERQIEPPLSDAAIVAGVDLLLSSIEGIALARKLDESLLEQAHALRREVRRVYPIGSTQAADPPARQKLFEDVAALLARVHRLLPPEERITEARIEAVDRAARSLELTTPLPQQSQSVERFFRHAAESLRVVVAKPARF